jgi:hypothetical protein
MPLLCVCVGIPLYMCLHTSIYVSAYLYTCVRIPPFVSASPIYGEVCCARAYVRCASSRVNESAYLYICVRMPLYVSAYLCMCPHPRAAELPPYALLFMCPHTFTCVFGTRIWRGVLRARLRHVTSAYVRLRPHTSAYAAYCKHVAPTARASSRCRAAATILCPHTSIYVSEYLDLCD